MKRKRKYNGKFAKDSQYFKERLVAPALLILTTAFTWGVSLSPAIYKTFYEVDSVQANAGQTQMLHEAESTPLYIEPKENLIEEIKETPEDKTQKQEIIEYIVEVFGEDSIQALQIADCESRYNPKQPGDEHLMFYDEANGEMIGDSIGIFQVRTGGKEKNGHIWNRARANGMTSDEFRVYLKDWKNNVDYAKTIFDRSGWKAWYNCMNKEL